MEQPIPDRNRRYTLEEYFALDDVSDVKYEYWDGLLVPHGGWETGSDGNVIGMAGGTDEHSEIGCNFIGELRSRLKGKSFSVRNSDLRVRSPRSGRYHFPDIIVACEPRVFDPPEKRITLINPQVIIEVLSPSTENIDRGDKFIEYLAIDSLREYILASQDKPRVQTFHRNAEGSWIVGPRAEGLNASITFPSLGVTVPLAEVYAGVEFVPPSPVPAV